MLRGTPYTVTGTVYSPALPGIAGLTVQLVDKNVGGDTVLGTTQTGSDGSTRSPSLSPPAYLKTHHKSQPDLQVHVSGRRGGPLGGARLLCCRLLGADRR